MLLVDAEVIDVRPLLTRERQLLVEFLASISEVQWAAPTALPGWRVKDVALHLLDDDLGRLARDRDGDDSGFIRVSGGLRELVVALNAKNERWVAAASGLSRRVVVELLVWSGEAIDRYLRDVDLDGWSTVGWASDDRVPAWFDLAREFTERWVHHQQIRDALGLPDGALDGFAEVVLGTFVWAYPFQYRVDAPVGTNVVVRFDNSAWTLTRTEDRWRLDRDATSVYDARVAMSNDAAWRLLTGGGVDPDRIEREGDDSLVLPLLEVRAALV